MINEKISEHGMLVEEANERREKPTQAAPLPLPGLGDDLDAVARTQLVLMYDVIRMGMRPEDRGGGCAPGLDRRDERADVGAGVHEEGRASLPIRNREGVRQPVGMHAPLDQHGARLTGTPEEEKEWPV